MESCNLSLKNLPVVDITKENLLLLWPSLIHSISSASFIALDVELSGLGNRKTLTTRCIEDRYAAIGEVAKTRAIISLGLSCFRHEPSPVPNEENGNDEAKPEKSFQWKYQVQTFNITLLCMEDYIVEPGALQFLIEHGFDFNKQYSHGVPYKRGNDKEETQNAQPSIRSLFLKLVHSKKSIIIHNGLVDLIFLYQNLYAELPNKLATFVADVEEMFEGGIYDTKYLAEFKLRYTASYLEYVFRKMQRFNASREKEFSGSVQISFPNYGNELPCVEYRDLSYTTKSGYSKDDICNIYANHGWCPNGNSCTKIHNVSIILDIEELSGSKKRKRAKCSKGKSKLQKSEDHTSDDGNDQIISEIKETNDLKLVLDEEIPRVTTSRDCEHLQISTTTHRASYDAFMTGFIMAIYLTTVKPIPDLTEKFVLAKSGISEIVNNIFLSGKHQPLLVRKSNFTSTSKPHEQKFNDQSNIA